MRYSKLALLFAIVAMPWAAQARTRWEAEPERYTRSPEELAKEGVAKVVESTQKETKIDDITTNPRAGSKVSFMGRIFLVDLTESRWGRRRHIRDGDFNSTYMNCYLGGADCSGHSSRGPNLKNRYSGFMSSGIGEEGYIKRMLEVYFGLVEQGIQPAGTGGMATRNSTFKVIKAMDKYRPDTDQAKLLMQMILTTVANNNKTPDGGTGDYALHKLLGTNDTAELKSLYEKYSIKYSD